MAIEQELLTPFTWGAGGRRKTPDEIERDKKLAALLMEKGGDYSPIQHWTQGGARVMSALAGVVRENRASKAAQDNAGASAANITAMLAGLNQQQPSGPSVIPAPQMPKQGPQPSPFPVESGSVKPPQPFQPPMQTEASPFVKPEGSVAPEQSFTQPPLAALEFIKGGDFKQNAPILVERLMKDLGVDRTQALAIVGNLGHESIGLQAGIQEINPLPHSGRGGLGWAQWTGPRRVAFENFLKQNNMAANDPEANYQFLLNEANGSHKSAFDALRSHNDLRRATIDFENRFENAHINHKGYDSRIKYAQMADALHSRFTPPTLGAPQNTGPIRAPVDQFAPMFNGEQMPPSVAEVPPQEMQPYQVAALGPVAAPQQQEVPAPQQQVAQAINPFSMSDVNEGNSVLALRPQRQMQQPVLPQAAPPPPAQQAQQPPQQRPQIDPRIIQAITNPYASREERAIAMEMIKPHITPTQYQMTPQPNGMVLRKDPRSGRVEVVNPYNGQVVTDPQQIPQGLRNTKFGLNPVWGVNEKGDVVPMQMGDDGTMRQSQMPEGVTVSQKPLKIDGGTEWVLMDPITRQIINRIPKNVAEVQKQQEIGKGEGQAIVNQPKVAEQKRQADVQANIVVQDIDRALDLVKTATLPTTGGVGSIIKSVPGTAAHDIYKLLDTVKSNAAFDKLQAMRAASPTGGALGSVSDKETGLLQAAIGNLEQSQSREQFVTNLTRVKELYLDVIHGTGNRPQAETAPQATPQTTAPKVRRYNPATGKLEEVQ